jgi:hypothetical protein
MAYVKQSDFVFDCMQCHTRCDGVSKGVYLFDNDVSFSEAYEQMIIDHINSTTRHTAAKTEVPGHPDIEIRDEQNQLYRYLEVKVQQRTFMHIEKHLGSSSLKPSETVALNLSDLLRYFTIQNNTKIKTVIVWVLLNRLCVTGSDKHQFYFQTSNVLEAIYNSKKQSRMFRRKSGEGDVVDGVHKGVTVNYHFSLKELERWTL